MKVTITVQYGDLEPVTVVVEPEDFGDGRLPPVNQRQKLILEALWDAEPEGLTNIEVKDLLGFARESGAWSAMTVMEARGWCRRDNVRPYHWHPTRQAGPFGGAGR